MNKKENNEKLIAIVRIRGRVNVRSDISETLERLNLKRVSNCSLIIMNDSYSGMVEKCKDYVAYGEIDTPTLELLINKRGNGMVYGEIASGGYSNAKLKEHMPLRLHPPRHGYKSTKLSVEQGGNLGYVGPKINELIKRMV